MKKTMMIISISIMMMLFLSFSIGAVSEYIEPPSLQEKVEKGELPPIEERLPDEPLVMNDEIAYKVFGVEDFTIGKYTEERYIGANWTQFDGYIFPALGVWNYKGIPLLIKDYKEEEDGRIWTFYLRKGLRWSDGELFTADDIMFWYDHVLKNKEITPELPSQYVQEGKLVEVTKIDDYTVEFEFTKSYPTFLVYLALDSKTAHVFHSPEHYCKQFHGDFVAADKLEEMVEQAGFESWYQLYENKTEIDKRPHMGVWNPVKWPPEEPSILVRNPYFPVVDEKGQQLPYVDTIIWEQLESDVADLRALTGELDTGSISFDLILEARKREKRGELQLNRRAEPTASNALTLAYNLNHKDPVLREIFQDARFRKAVSHALNREELSELITYGLSKPRQTAPTDFSPFYDEKYEKAYIEYDPEKANRLLDEIGLDQRDNEGYRLRPDGKRLSITYTGLEVHHFHTTMEQIVEQLKEVGLYGQMRTVSFSHVADLYSAGEHDAGFWRTWGSDSGRLLESAAEFVPMSTMQHPWGSLWATWRNTNGESGEEPPEEIKDLYTWYDEARSTTDQEVQQEYMKKVLDQAILENLYTIGVMETPGTVEVALPKWRNLWSMRPLLWTHNDFLLYADE